MYEIDKNTPAPPFKKGRNPKYPFAEMAVGDSILVEARRWDSRQTLAARRSAHLYAERHDGYKFQTKFTDEGLRIWRIEVE